MGSIARFSPLKTWLHSNAGPLFRYHLKNAPLHRTALARALDRSPHGSMNLISNSVLLSTRTQSTKVTNSSRLRSWFNRSMPRAAVRAQLSASNWRADLVSYAACSDSSFLVFGLKFFCLRRRFLKLLSRVSSLVFGVFWMYWGVVGAATRDRQVVIKTQETRHA